MRAFQGTAVGVLALCYLLNMFGRGMADTYAVFLLPLEREFGWTRSQLTGVYAVYLLVNGATAPFVGMLFDRIGPRWVYGIGMALLGGAYLLAQSIGSLWQFYLFIGAMVGLAVSFSGMVPASALLARWYRERLSTAIGIAFSAVGVGTVVFVPLAQQVVLHHDWRTVYQGFGYALLVIVPLVLFAVPWRRVTAGHGEHQAQARKAAQGQGWTLRSATGTGIYWGMAATFFCTATAMFSVVVQLVVFLIDAGFSPLAAATTYGVIGMLSSISIMGSGFAADRFGVRRTVTLSFVGSGSGMVLLLAMAHWPSYALLAVFVPVFGLCMGARGPIISSICARYFAGPKVATIYGTIYSCNALGAAFGSLMGGVLHDLTAGYRVGLVFSITFVVLAALPMWVVPGLRNYR